MLTAPDRAELPFLLRIFYGRLLLEKVTQGNHDPAENSRQIDPFREGHFLLDNNF